MRVVLVAVLAVCAACVQSPAVRCENGLICPAGARCDEVRGRCLSEDQVVACEGLGTGDLCTIANAPGVCDNGACLPISCGNGHIDPEEVCDDGNLDSLDGCRGDCRSDERCGNGVFDPLKGEECDCGDAAAPRPGFCVGPNADSGSATCLLACVLPHCGDGFIDAGEACDAGAANSNAPDAACRSNCQPRRCSDQIVDVASGELCDDGNLSSGDDCSFDCGSLEVCGNDYPDFVTGEQCDDGNAVEHDGCAFSCLLETPTWNQRVFGIPGPRSGSAMAYDAARGTTVLFGGLQGSTFLGDTWTWNGVAWTQVTTLGGPSPRAFHSMVYDAARGRVVLFGGNPSLSGDTWEWDGDRWVEANPAHRPTSRAGHSMAYDAARKRAVVFGGLNNPGRVWEWDGVDWADVTPVLPLQYPMKRGGTAMAYDAARGVIVMFAGRGDDGGDGVDLNDTWTWNGTTWSNVTPPGVSDSPSVRFGHTMTFDATLQQVVVVGGRAVTGAPTSDAWSWNGTTWNLLPTTTPQGVHSHAMTYDSRRDRVVIFGGDNGTGTGPLATTWEAGTSGYIEVTPTTAPPPRSAHVMAHDGRAVILFGGYDDATETTLGDTWLWDGGAWHDATPTGLSPGAREASAMAYDRKRNRVVLFGGSNRSSGLFGDTWEWDGATWTERTPAGGSPSARTDFAMAYDAERERIVLFGGRNYTVPSLRDTWLWDGDAWSEVTTGTSPPWRSSQAMAYDPERHRVVMFAGRDDAVSLTLQDTWEWDGTAWSEVPTALTPRARFSHTMTYDPVRRRILMMGGADPLRLADIWEWDGIIWVQQFADMVGPGARSHATMAFDHQSRRLLMFGGTAVVQTMLGDTWLYHWDRPQTTDDVCLPATDGDQDGLVTCDDLDCWSYCTPWCPPQTTCPAGAPRCGDATCDLLEDCRRCAADCGACDQCGDFICDGIETVSSCPGDCS